MAINFLNVGAFPDDVKLTFGAGSDLQIFHNATDSIIYNGTGALMLRGSDVRIQAADASATYLTLDSSEAAFTTDVRLSGSKKLYTWTGSNDNYITYNSWYIWTGQDVILRNSGTGPWKFQTNGANDVLTLDSSQNATFAGDVGIGGAPAYALDISGGSAWIDSDWPFYFGSTNAFIEGNSSGTIVRINASAGFKVTDGGTTRFDIDTDGDATFAGNVTLGSSSKVSDEWMYIDSDANSSAGIQLLRGGASKWFIYNPGGGNNFKIYDNVGGGYMEIEPVGNVTFSSNILTNTDSSSDIGTTSKRWANLWVDSINGGAVVSGSYLPLAGGTMTGNIILNDSVQIKFGTGGAESFIYSDGSDTWFQGNSGNIWFYQGADDKDIKFSCDDGSGGVTEYFRLDGSMAINRFYKNVRLDDTVQLQVGSGADCQIVHNGTDTQINNLTGHLQFTQLADDKDISFASDNGAGGDTIYFYLDGSLADGTYTYTTWVDNGVIGLGTGSDLQLYHTGTDSYISNKTGDLYIKTRDDDKDVIFQSDDGSGGTATYFYLDGSAANPGNYLITLFPDNSRLVLGDGWDIQMWHDGVDGKFYNATGDWSFEQAANDKDIIFYCDDGSGGSTVYITLDGSAGYTTAQKDIRFDDGIAAAFGTGIDAFIKHSGSEFNIYNDIGAMNFIQRQNDGNMVFQSDDGSGGTATYFSLDGGSSATNELYTKWTDYSRIALGSGKDLQLYHDASHSYIQEQGTGDLRIEGDSVWIREADGTNQISAYQGTAKLYKDGTERLETTSAGVTITGALSITGDGSNPVTFTETGAGKMTIAAPDDIILDAVSDIVLDADGADIRFKDAGVEYGRINNNSSGNFLFLSPISDKDIIFKGNDGGSEFVALTLDMSDAGTAIFNHHLSIPDYITHYQDASTRFGFSGASTFVVNTGGTTALTIDSSQDATFTGDISAVALTLTGKGTSAATVDGDGSTTMATKGWVESKLTGATLYQGTWDPSGGGYGSPDLSTAALQVNGYYYICSADGTAEPNGTGTEPDTWHTGDWVIWNDDVGSGEWQKIDNTTVLSGAGTGDYLARWTDTETLGDSVLLASGSDILMPQYLIHTGDTDTYFGFSANDTFTVYTAGGEGLKIDSNRAVTLTGTLNMGASQKIYLGGNDSRMHVYHTGSSGTANVLTKEGDLNLVNQSHGDDIVFKTEDSGGTVVTPLTLDSGGDATFAGTVSVTAADSITIADYILHSGDDSKFGFPSNDTFKIRTGGVDRFTLTNTDATFAGDVSVIGVGNATLILDSDSDNSGAAGSYLTFRDNGATKWVFYKETNNDLYVYNPGVGYPMHFLAGGDLKLLEDGNDLIVGTLSSGNTSTLTVNHEGGASAVASFKARTNRAQVIIGDNDTNGYLVAENGIFGVGRTASISTNNINIDASHNVGIRTITPAANLDVQGGIIAGGKTMYTLDYSGGLTTTGNAVAGLDTGSNGYSALFIFTCSGGGGYQRIVYSCRNESGTWNIDKDIDEGVNSFDVTYAADGSDNITFTFKSRSGTQGYWPKVTVEAIGNTIQTSYIN